jgi:hypothetical protein
MIDGKELRVLIRDVIATELAAAKAGGGAAAASAPAPEHRVRIVGDADLAAFAKQVLALAENPATRHAIAAGSYRFRLEGGGAAPVVQHAAPASAAAATRIDSGVVTETMLAKLPRGTRRLEIGSAVSVTPLARDRARNLGITIERMKP